MKKLLWCLALLIPLGIQAQSVAVIGLNNFSSSGNQDGFAFVALEDIPDGTKIFFTERDYSAAADAFSNAIPELVLEWTASGVLAKGCVVAIHETSSNTGTVKASSTGCNGGSVTANFDSFSIGTSDPLYAFSSTGSGSSASILSGLTEIFSVMYINTGSLSSDQNPISDYPNAVVIDLNNGSGSGQYNPGFRNNTITNANLTVTTNHQTIGGNAYDPLDVTIFANLVGNDPCAGVGDTDMDGTCDDVDGCPNDPNKIAAGTCGCGNPEPGTPCDDGDECTIFDTIQGDCSCAGTFSEDKSPIALIGVNNVNTTGVRDGFSFVALEDIPSGTKVFFTEHFYDNTTDAFTVSSEGVTEWTASGILEKGCVVVIHETASNVGGVVANSAGCNGGSVTANFGSFSIGSNDPIYAFASTGSGASGSILNGVTDIYSAIYIDGAFPSQNNPKPDFPRAIVTGFNVGSGAADFMTALRSGTVLGVDIENGGNYTTTSSGIDPLDATGFISAAANNCCASGDTDMDGVCNDIDGCPNDPLKDAPGTCGCGVADTDTDMDGTLDCNDACPNDPNKIAAGTCGCGNPEPGTACDDGDVCTINDVIQADCSCAGTLDDNTPPVATCAGVIAPVTADANCMETVADILSSPLASAVDNCDANPVLTQDPLPGTQVGVGVTVITITATDASGNQGSCTYNLTVLDGTPPVIDCASVNGARNNDPGQCSFTMPGTGFDPSVSDSCPGAVTLTNDVNGTSSLAGETFPVGTTTVTWTATDVAGNSSSCTIDIIITDNEPPTATCSDMILQLNAVTGQVTFNVFAAGGISNRMDNCGLPGTVGVTGPTLFDCDDVGDRLVTIFNSDVNGNTVPCTVTLTIADDNFNCNPPVAVCQDVVVNADANCMGTAAATAFDGGSTDADGDALSFSVDPVGPYPKGETMVTLTVSDGDATDQCTAKITVNDVTPPVIQCQDATIVLNNPTEPTNPFITGALVDRTDNCDLQGGVNVTGPNVVGCNNLGTYSQRIFVKDLTGNTTTCDVLITVVEGSFICNTPPTAVCQSVSVDADGNCEGTAAATDFDGGSTDPENDALSFSVSPAGPYALGTTNVTLTVSDGEFSDQCMTTITVTDNTPPIIDCSGIDGTRDADPGLCSFTMPGTGFDPVFSDNCPGVTISNDFNNSNTLAGETFPVGSTSVVWTATDGNGNTASCGIAIIISDTQAPTIDCSAIDVTRDNDPGFCSFTMPGSGFDPTFADNCPGASISNDYNASNSLAGETFPVGSTTVVWTATDAAGNSASCTIVIVVSDTEAPTIDCSAIDVTRDNDAGQCSFTMPGTGFDPTFADNCPGASISNDFNNSNSLAGETFPVGSTTVVWTATDAAGNSASCTIVIVISDTEAPVIDCSGIDVTQNTDPGVCSFTMPGTGFDPVLSDNCPGESMVNDFNGGSSLAGETFPLGTTTVVWTATDNAGNTSSCTINIIISDNEDPSITCPTGVYPVVLDGTTGLYEFTEAPTLVTSSDNCTAAPIETFSRSVFSCVDAVVNGGMVTVTAQATDEAGNTASCTFEVSVADVTPPVIACPGDFNVNNDPGECGAVVTFDDPVATDNCAFELASLDVGTSTQDNEEGVMMDISVPAGGDPIQLTKIRIDKETPGSTYNVAVYFKDGTNSGFLNNEAAWTFLATQTSPGGSGKRVTIDIPGVNVDPGQTIAFYIATISSGLDWQTFDPPANPVTNGEISITNSREVDTNNQGPWGFNEDNGNEFFSGVLEYTKKTTLASQSAGLPSGSLFPVGSSTVTYSATDLAGNTGMCSFDVNVTDNEAPVISQCQGNPMTFNGEEDFLVEDFVDLTATDNCDIASVDYAPEVITCDQLGETVTINITVTDIYGNASTCSTTIDVLGLPCGAMAYDDHISCPGSSVSYDVQEETFSLTSVNCYYGSPFNADEAAYVKYELCGDSEIITEVQSISAPPFGWAGVVMREGPEAGSKKMSLAYNGSNFARREVRSQTNGMAFPQQFPSFGKNWLRLVRQGNFFRGFVSTNGIFWQQVMVASIQMNDCIEVGLFVTNYTPFGTVTAVFGNTTVSGGGAPLVDLDTDLNLAPQATTATAQVNAFPNPTAGQVTVELTGFQNQETLLELTDAQGRLVRVQQLGEIDFLQQNLDLGDLPSGVYWLRISAANDTPIVKRIMVQRP